MSMEMKHNERGFTLLEIIVTLIVAAILGAMFVQFMGTSLTQSANVVVSTHGQQQLNQVMENITADYKRLLTTSSTPLTALAANVGAEGTSQNNAYGLYDVIVNHRITFTSSNPATEQADANGKIQKITIRHKGQNLTALFTTM
jgi:prepilin-type N-terminal cleavage/methylation domain-containing protein